MFYVQIGYISVYTFKHLTKLYTNEQDKMNKTCNDKGICYLTFPDFLVASCSSLLLDRHLSGIGESDLSWSRGDRRSSDTTTDVDLDLDV